MESKALVIIVLIFLVVTAGQVIVLSHIETTRQEISKLQDKVTVIGDIMESKSYDPELEEGMKELLKQLDVYTQEEWEEKEEY